MAISCTISRTLLALGDLELVGANGYEIMSDGLDPGEVMQRQDWAKSPFIHGGALMSSVDDIATGKLDVEVFGSSRADIQTKVTTLIAAFKQLYYVIDFDLDGTSWSWLCYRANRAMDANFPFYLGNLTVCHFGFARQPTPQAGPI